MGSTALLMQQSLQISSAPLTTPCRSSTDRNERRSGALRPYPVCGTVVCAGTVRFTDRAVLGPPIWQSPGGCFFAKEHWRAPSGRAPRGEDVGRHTVGLPCVALLTGEAAVPDPGFRSGSPFASSDLARLRHRGLGGVLAGSWLGPCTFPPARVRLTAARSLSARC